MVFGLDDWPIIDFELDYCEQKYIIPLPPLEIIIRIIICLLKLINQLKI